MNYALNELNEAIDNLVRKVVIPGIPPTNPVKDISQTTDGEYTFHGEVSTNELITGKGLANLIGLSLGIDSNNTEPWLKFTVKDKDTDELTTLFVAKKPYKRTLAWKAIDDKGAVTGRIVIINNQKYKVRLLKGANQLNYKFEGKYFQNSEWNRIMLPIHENVTSDTTKKSENVGPNDTSVFNHNLGSGSSGRYTADDLWEENTSWDDGKWSWTQGLDGVQRLLRSNDNIISANYNTFSHINSRYSWRPVLELVE